MGALDQIAGLLRDAASDLRADLDRMDAVDVLRTKRDEAQTAAYHLFASANEHDRLERLSTGTQRTEHRLMSQRLWGEYDIARKEYLRLDRELAALLPPSDAGSFLDHEERYLRQRAAAGCAVTYHGD